MEAFIELTCDCGLMHHLTAMGERTCERCGASFEIDLRYVPAPEVAA